MLNYLRVTLSNWIMWKSLQYTGIYCIIDKTLQLYIFPILLMMYFLFIYVI